jgi:hypothetical protein
MERGDSGVDSISEIQGLKKGRAEVRYNQLRTYRDVWLERARRASRLTIPFLIPESDEILVEAAREQELPWNGIGAMGVNNICSRLLLALLPPTGGLFRLTKDELKAAAEEAEATQMGTGEEDIANQKIEIEKALALLDRSIERSIATSNDRVALFEALMHLIVGGAVMLYRAPTAMKCFHLNKHVLLRDPMGQPVEAVACETYLYASLNPKLKAVLDEADKLRGDYQNEDNARRDYRRIKVFTHIKWEPGSDDSPGKVTWHQEVGGYIVPGTEGSEPADASPWMPLRLFRIDGDSYGPGYVEWCALADLSNLDGVSQAVAEGSAAAARQIVGRKPSAITSKDAFAAAPNLSVIDGQPQDFFPIETSSVRDLGVAFQEKSTLEDRLSKIFLLPNIRQSERTTAEEVRLQITQIEQMLGSIYSILTVEFQYPYVRRILALLRKRNRLPELPGVEPLIVIGLAALGRQSDAERLNQFALGGNQAMPQQFGSMIDGAAWARQWATAIGVDPMLVKSDKRIQEEQAAAMEAQQQQQLIQAGMGDPQKLANAGMAVQQMAEGPPPDGQPVQPTSPEMQP